MIRRITHLVIAAALIAAASAAQAQTIPSAPQPSVVHHIVVSVELKLKATKFDPASAGETTQLLITARDTKGAVIVDGGSYVDIYGKPLTINISNSWPYNTVIAPTAFSKPNPSQGASNVATVTFTGRAHFHYPTFSVANAGLPALPKGGVTLTYVPFLGNAPDYGISQYLYLDCVGLASVGGFEYGPYFALNHDSGCPPGDILRTSPFKTIVVNPVHDNAIVTLGFGSDKVVYFGYNHPAPNAPTQFGYLRNLAVRASANVTSISGLTLGNDGSLWFTGFWHGKALIGKLPPANASGLHPMLYAIPNADNVFGIQPGNGDVEAFLYHAPGGIYLGTIGTSLVGFRGVHVWSSSANPGFGDLLAAHAGTFDVSAPGSLFGSSGSIYQIAPTGKVSILCTDVEKVLRLSDGTGMGFRQEFPPPYQGYSAVIHVVPGVACDQIPNPPESYGLPFQAFSQLLGVDTTTADWLFYYNPNGHQFGLF